MTCTETENFELAARGQPNLVRRQVAVCDPTPFDRSGVKRVQSLGNLQCRVDGSTEMNGYETCPSGTQDFVESHALEELQNECALSGKVGQGSRNAAVGQAAE